MQITVIYALLGVLALTAIALLLMLYRDARRINAEFDGGFSADNEIRVTRIMSDHVITIHGDER